MNNDQSTFAAALADFAACEGLPTMPETYGDVGKCPQCGQQSRSYSRGCSTCGYGRPLVDERGGASAPPVGAPASSTCRNASAPGALAPARAREVAR